MCLHNAARAWSRRFVTSLGPNVEERTCLAISAEISYFLEHIDFSEQAGETTKMCQQWKDRPSNPRVHRSTNLVETNTYNIVLVTIEIVVW